MGIPAYFRWISEKYPNILVNCVEHTFFDPTTGNFDAVDASQPNPNGVEYDNLYLDMNGIIHPCTHPEDRPVPTTESAMFDAVFDYIDRIFAIVRPRKLLYLAIDGVAPRAKINQQRSRRFRAAREAAERESLALELRKEWDKMGLQIKSDDDNNSDSHKSKKSNSSKPKNPDPTDYSETPFDSNVITPGTPFMERLAVALRQYVTRRIENSAAWRDVVVIFSDASVPGEGEHKIAEFIRRERTHPSYNPNLRHVMYGLDADLIMLALATHEVNFTILREEVFPKNGRQKAEPADTQPEGPSVTNETQNDTALQMAEKSTSPLLQASLGGRKPFIFLHVNVLREYLDFEFRHDIENELNVSKKFDELRYDLERVLDDFVFLCFFVGNDFLPHLPTLDIREGAIEYLIELYKSEFVNTGYLTSSGGNIDFVAVRKLLEKTSSKEDEIFQQRAQREKSYSADRESREKQKRPIVDTTSTPTKRQKSASADEVPPSSLVALGGKRSGKIGTAEGRAAVDAALDLSFRRLKSSESRKSKDSEFVENASKDVGQLTEGHPLESSLKTEAEFKEALQERIRAKGEVDEVQDTVRLGESGWKQRYYEQKFGWLPHHKSEKMLLLRKYFEGLHWVMKYYYVGCISWGWYYPYHYAPFASDLVESDVVADDLHMEMGKPFKPFMQLQAVMPASSGLIVLPKCYSDLMVDPNSPIIDYYPEDFAIDLNGKRFAWQGVALLPFIDEGRLRAALDPLKDQLTEKENFRNSFGEPHVMVHRASVLGKGRRKKSTEDSEEMKKISVDRANGLLFGKTSYPIVKYGGKEGTVLTMRFELPEYAPHQSNLLASATVPTPTLSELDKADTKRLGWKAAKFGPLGRAARELMIDRQRRQTAYKQRRGYGSSPFRSRGYRGGGRGQTRGGTHLRTGSNQSFEANAVASGMFSAVGVPAGEASDWTSQPEHWNYQQQSVQPVGQYAQWSTNANYGGYHQYNRYPAGYNAGLSNSWQGYGDTNGASSGYYNYWNRNDSSYIQNAYGGYGGNQGLGNYSYGGQGSSDSYHHNGYNGHYESAQNNNGGQQWYAPQESGRPAASSQVWGQPSLNNQGPLDNRQNTSWRGQYRRQGGYRHNQQGQ